MKNIIKNIILELWPNARVKLHKAAGGFFIEVIHGKLNVEQSGSEYIKFINKFREIHPQEIAIFHDVAFYNSGSERFKVNGTLHTIPCEVDGTMTTVTQGANDSFVKIAEIDVDACLNSPTECSVLRAIADDSFGHGIEQGIKYRELQFAGDIFPIEKWSQIDGEDGCDIWQIEIYPQEIGRRR